MVDNTDNTAVQSENFGTVTDSATPVDNKATDTKSDKSATPKVELRDGKMFVDGVRVYSRDDTSKIAANAKKEVEARLLQELNVDSIDSVKSVVRTLQETTNAEEGLSLNVNSLRDAVKKREATVEELKAQVTRLKTDLMLKDHMSSLINAMPSNWNADQKTAVIDLMKARNMLAGNRGGMGAGMGDFGSAARPFTMESFRADPGYAFRLGEGLKALERSAAARGGLMSGATGKALQRYGQEAASQEYGNAFNRFYTERNALLNPLLALSGRGQTSASESGQAGQQFGQQAANTLTGIGNVMASGQVGQANAINQAIGQGVSMYNQAQNQNLLNQVLARSMG